MIRRKIVLTGGHAGPTAYATIQELKRDCCVWDIYWVGVKSAIEGKKDPTFEFRVFPKININLHLIAAGRIQRKFTKFTIPSLLKIPLGFFQALLLLLKIRPGVVLSFGGYAAYPVVISAWILGIPVIVHEQTSVAGRANIHSAYFARKIAIARETSRKYFPADKTVLTGNPVSDEIKSLSFNKLRNPKNILITGGTRGSKIINDTVFQLIPELVKEFKVVHQTGEASFQKAVKIKSKLGEFSGNYHIKEFFLPDEWHKVLGEADIVISRAGANIVSELLLLRKPSLLVPIPFSYLDEQTENAKYLQSFGLAVVIKQDLLDEKILLAKLWELISQYRKMIKNSKHITTELDSNASLRLVRLVRQVAK